MKYVFLFFTVYSLNCFSCTPLRQDPLVKPEWYVISSYKKSKRVVKGKVADVETSWGREDANPRVEYEYSKIYVGHTYKGNFSKELTVRSPITCCLCGQKLEIGKEYIFFLIKGEGSAYGLARNAVLIENSSLELRVIEDIEKGKIKPNEAKMREYIYSEVKPELE